MKRITLIFAATIGSMLTFPLVARADQAILVHDALFEIGPGEVVEYDDVLIVSQFGIPTVVFDGATGFADDETVVATIELSLKAIDGLGSVELLSSPTISGTTPADWTTGEVPDELSFQPRHRAPLHRPVGRRTRMRRPPRRAVHDPPWGECDARRIRGNHGLVLGGRLPEHRLVQDHMPRVGTRAEAPAPEEPAPGAPTVTPPPTNTLPLDSDGSRGEWADWLVYVTAAAGAAALVSHDSPVTAAPTSAIGRSRYCSEPFSDSVSRWTRGW